MPPPFHRPEGPIGAILAGGAGTRLGGNKAGVLLAGRPLLDYPLRALQAVLEEVVVVAKADTILPEAGVPVWVEPDQPRHPLTGLLHALARAAPRPVLVCAVDLPFVAPSLLRSLAGARDGAPAVIASSGGRLQPHLGLYRSEAAGLLAGSAARGEPLRAAVARLGPRLVEADEDSLFNVNTPEDVLAAVARLGGKRHPKVKS